MAIWGSWSWLYSNFESQMVWALGSVVSDRVVSVISKIVSGEALVRCKRSGKTCVGVEWTKFGKKRDPL